MLNRIGVGGGASGIGVGKLSGGVVAIALVAAGGRVGGRGVARLVVVRGRGGVVGAARRGGGLRCRGVAGIRGRIVVEQGGETVASLRWVGTGTGRPRRRALKRHVRYWI